MEQEENSLLVFKIQKANRREKMKTLYKLIIKKLYVNLLWNQEKTIKFNSEK